MKNWKHRLFGTWSWKRPFYSLASIYFLLLLVSFFAADRFIFQPPDSTYPAKGGGFFTIPDSEVAAFFIAPESGRAILLWSHGNAEDLSSVSQLAKDLYAEGFCVLAYDYPGYGRTPGVPNEQGCYQAIQTAYQYLVKTRGYSPDQIILCGQSVGSGPTTWLAARESHQSIVLLSPFRSAFRTVTRFPLFPGDRFPNHENLRQISTPLLIIHGKRDRVVPHSEGKKLFEESASEDKEFLSITEAGHNDLLMHVWPKMIEKMRGYRRR